MAVKVDTQKEIIFGSSDPNVSRVLSKKVKNGELRKVAPRIYTTNLIDSMENIVHRNLMDILAYRYPAALISHRSAKEMRPTATGDFFLTNSTTRRVTDLPGIILNFVKGPKASSHDIPFMGMHISGEHRYMLENMQVSRKSGDESRVLPVSVIENKLEQILLIGGEDRLNQYRDELRTVAEELGMQTEFTKINSIISALLSTHDAKVLSTDSAKALAAGNPFDKTRVELFEVLFDAIKDRYFVIRNNRNTDEESFRLFSFFESYFSNYIEGTEFDVEEAKAIVDSGIPMPRRDEDSHDILGTFKVLSNRAEMMKTPTSPDELFAILSHRHSILLEGRPHMNPGIFKTKNNRAGMNEFVEHKLVKGTLSQGFKYYAALTDPFARAIFMMFMISEVHPFNDGNGRIARVMMNAELVRADQSRIIVPTVFREDYILALRKLTRHKDPLAYINVMTKLHQFSDNLYGTDFTELKNYLAACNAYEEPSQAKLQIIDRTINGAVVIATIPEGKNKPYHDNKGVIWVKNGADKRKVFDNSELAEMMSESGNFDPDEAGLPNATIEDLDVDTIKLYLMSRFAPVFKGKQIDELNMKDYSLDQMAQFVIKGSTIERLLKNLRFIRPDGKLTVAAMLLFGKYTQRWLPVMTAKCISFLGNSVSGTQFRDKMHDMEIEGNLLHQFRTIMNFFTRNLRKVQVEKEFNSLGQLEIPYESLTQYLVNALVHRSLSIKAPIRIFIFDDRVEIHSPGSLPNGLTIEDIKNGTSMPRNIFLFTNANYLLPYTGAGSGVRRALEYDPDVIFSNGVNDKEITHSANEFVITIPRKVDPVSDQASGKADPAQQKTDPVSDQTHSKIDQVQIKTDQVSDQSHSKTDQPKKGIDTNSDQPHSKNDQVPHRIKISKKQLDIKNFCSIPRTAKEILERAGVTNHFYNRKKYIYDLVEAGILERTIPDKPNDPNQKYRRKL